jgi:aerobic-type carbon monoxide dehydrogenase small subunit (CoxS/CutS family)
MKIECSIDGKNIILNVNSNKPLSQILTDELETGVTLASCNSEEHGGCMVLVNEEVVLASLVPAFRLRGAKITTFTAYQKSRFWHDLERAYEDTGSHPCPNCYASKSLIFESLLQSVGKVDPSQDLEEQTEEENIVREVRLNSCPCLDAHEIIDIYKAAATYRKRRRGVRRY